MNSTSTRIVKGQRVTWASGPASFVAFGTVKAIGRKDAYGQTMVRVSWDDDSVSLPYVTSITNLTDSGE